MDRAGKIGRYARAHWKQLLAAAVFGGALLRGMSTDAAVQKATEIVGALAGLLGG